MFPTASGAHPSAPRIAGVELEPADAVGAFSPGTSAPGPPENLLD